MKIHALIVLIPVLLAGCASVETPANTVSGEVGVDPISRNLTQTQGGSIRDPYTLSAPPVRREYVQEH